MLSLNEAINNVTPLTDVLKTKIGKYLRNWDK